MPRKLPTSGAWWLTTLGGVMVTAATVVASNAPDPKTRSVATGIAGVLGALLGISHPGTTKAK